MSVANGSRRFAYVPPNETVWKGLRKHDVTSTESAALFGLSPYMSHFELYHRKKNKDITDIQMNDRMLWGTRMQNVIAEGIGMDNGVIVRPEPEYMRIVRSRMGASFDYEIVGIIEDPFNPGQIHGARHPATYTLLQRMFMDHGPGLFEIKATGYVEFRDNWTRNDDKTITAPGHIEIQLQHQLHVADSYKWGAIGVLVAGNTPKVTARLRDREVGDSLEAAIYQLWLDIQNGNVPDPKYPDDAAYVKMLNANIEDGKIYDGRNDPDFASLCGEYRDYLDSETDAKARKDSAAAQIADIMKDASRALVNGFNVSRWVVAETVVPSYTRASFPSVKITRKKAK